MQRKHEPTRQVRPLRVAAYLTALLVTALVVVPQVSRAMDQATVQGSFYRAAYAGDLVAIRYWLKRGARPYQKDITGRDGYSYELEGWRARNHAVPTSGVHPDLDAIEALFKLAAARERIARQGR